ncbi:hypothetical protein BCR39DRAFT_514939 [Naematelia encephala]|uniref:NmrA-like domain-containing protein n=1 Tax=Naematelia encephala TaxID=71784 RepID=A0A1Y2BJ66_9TREE|nr:hypothetical protein BCR39DRAFT_514939 [Naematelia encephala]
MAPHTVALQGHTGRIGGAAYQALLPGHAAGKFKLVIVHRPGSDVSKLPKDVEAREIDFENADEATITKAVQGINFYVSAVGFPGLASQANLLKPFAATPGFVTYLIPVFGNPFWTQDYATIEDKRIVNFLQMFNALTFGPTKLGIGRTSLQSGVFADYFTDPNLKYLDTDLAANRVLLPKGGENRGTILTSPEALGEAIAELAARDPASIKDKDFYVYDYAPTGNEIIQVLTKLHGKAPQVKPETDEDYEKAMDTGVLPTMSPAIYRHCWGTGVWNWRGERIGPKVNKDWEALAKTYYKK